ncbi:MAG: TonB family protein [Bacteroidota bacterium]|jgi:TonB family protein|nr:TonB family protein [Bacteroidota bacterium]
MNIKRILIFILPLLLNNIANAQIADESRALYDQGNIAFSQKEYKKADSLFTLSLLILPHPDTYYNRAVCRRKLNDFAGYCTDLGASAGLNDKEARKIYWRECVKSDTIFEKNNGELANRTNFDTAQLILAYTYNSNFDYEKIDNQENILISRIKLNNDTIYRKCIQTQPPQFDRGMNGVLTFININSKFAEHVQNNNLYGKVYIALMIDETGQVFDSKLLLGLEDNSTNELAESFLKMPSWKPAQFNNQKVKYQMSLVISFNGEIKEVAEFAPLKRSLSQVFTVVEKMPEFPGGPMQMMKFIQKTIRYPRNALEKGLSGKCFLKFIVNVDGSLSDIEVIKGVEKCPECDAEAVRTVQMMPKWQPGFQNGKPVRVFFNLPINFQLR